MSRQPRAVVVVASSRAADGSYEDRTGPLIVERLHTWGYAVRGPVVVADGSAVGQAIREALALQPAVILTTGGTGIAPADVTPEQTEPFLDRLLPGIPEAIRAAGLAAGVATSVLSRGLAGIAGSTVVVNLPGSRGAVLDALGILEGVLGHALDQVGGGDHGPGEADAAGPATGGHED
ncbi:MAG: MogA/MoaB family molybdenum cofactor biosynthesis protein [Pseudonocardia sp.]